MAIVTGDLYKGFTFGDISSKAYGVYITQEAAYDAPERDTEVVEIAGRNGAYILDKGRYKNITVSYKCGIALDDEQSFESAIRTFRNALASKAGKYVRLEDEYNPNEYRQAAFLGGIEVDMADRRAGEFTVSFDAKPQRFLKSGETAVTIGGDVTNPQTKSGSIVSIESDGGDKVTSLVAQITPVQAGSGDPSPTNVRPITGWTGCNVNVAGKNLAPTENGTVTAQGIASDSYTAYHIPIYLKAGVTYTLSAVATSFTRAGRIAFRHPTAGSTLIPPAVASHEGERISTTYTPTESGMVRLAFFAKWGQSGTAVSVYNDVQLEIGSTATDYEPYKGTTTTTALGRTVYGGTLDVVTGVLTVTHKFLHLTSVVQVSTPSGAHVYWRFVINEKGINGATAETIICNMAKSAYGEADNTCYVTSAGSLLLLFPEDQTLNTKALVDAWLANHELQICYKLATPQTYNLTAQQVELLTGQNNVWADTGDITITWGDDPNKLVNPTLYDSHPLLHVWGYGDIGIGGDTLSINNDEYGRTLLANRLSKSATSVSSYLDESAVLMLNSGDDVFVSAGSSVVFPLTFRGSASINIISATIANSSPYDFPMESSVSNFGNYVTVSVSLPQLDFIFNQTLQHLRSNIRVTINYTEAGVSKTSTAECQIHAQYSLTPLGRYRVALFYYDVAVDKFHNPSTAVMTIQPIYGVSTQRPFSDDADFYFDLDIGEAYKIEDGQIISVNNAVTIPAQLPTLKSGANTIAYDDTITQFKVVPRWWEV